MQPVTITPKIEESWNSALHLAFQKPSFLQLKQFLLEEKRHGAVIYPPGGLIFNAFNRCPFDKVKVVILGQDPYHGEGQAHGLCFSVPKAVPLPPSLVNIFKELHNDLGIPVPSHGNLDKWAAQGVLLLNSSLTVRAHQASSHARRGWEEFTDEVIVRLNERKKSVVFLLWGKPAQEKGKLIDPFVHHVLTAAHPSPFSAHKGFFGCGHFSRTNTLLKQIGETPIDWRLE